MDNPHVHWTELHTKAAQGDVEGVLTEIANGADINARHLYGWTPLQLALAHCTDEKALPIVNALIDHGADVDAQENEGYTALHIAAFEHSTECVQALLDAGANPLLTNHQGQRPSHAAGRNAYDHLPLANTLSSAERRHELKQIAAQARPAEAEIAPPRRSSGFMM